MGWDTIDVDCECGKVQQVPYRDFDLHDDMDCYHDDCYQESDLDRLINERVHILNDIVQKAHIMLGHHTMSIINCREAPCGDMP